MKEVFEVFSENHILILGIVLFILGLFMLGYLLTLIISNKRKEKMIMEKLYEEPIKEEPKQEIEKIELENQEKISNELEEMLNKMQQTLDKKEEIDNVANFEKEQEENAIISYQELLKAAKKDFPQMNLVEEKIEEIELIPDTKEEIGIIEEIEEPMVQESIEIVKTEEKPEEKKFKSSIFISPLGVTNTDNQNYYKEVKIRRDYLKEMADSRFNTVDIQTDDLDYEKVQNEKFLEDLKSFRSNL